MPRDQEPLASIDDLLAGPLTHEIEQVPVEPRGEPGRLAGAASWLFWASLVSGLASAAVFVVTVAVGYKISYALLFCAFFALVALRRALTTLAAPRLVVGAPPQVAAPSADLDGRADGLEAALTRWHNRMAWSQRDPDRFAAMVRPRLAEIVDERLRQRHGITRASDPQKAREIMGEQLWTFLVSPPARKPNPRELATVVKDMEKL